MIVRKEDLESCLGERKVLREWESEYGCDMREVSLNGMIFTESDGNGKVPRHVLIEAIKNSMELCDGDED